MRRHAALAGLLLSWTLGGGCASAPGPADGADVEADAGASGDATADTGAFTSTLGQAPAVCGATPYTWLPHEATATSPGHLVAHEEVTNFDFSAQNLSTLLGAIGVKLPLDYKHDVRLFRFRYTTQDRGALTEATGFVAVPTRVAGQTQLEVDLLVYLHGTAGFSDACAPSAKTLDPVAGAALATVGHVVVAPDYLGLNGLGAPSTQLHPYVLAEPTALASLDAARAGRELLAKVKVPGVTARPGLLVLGGSQGGHAALAMAHYGAHYAPDEPIVAVAASVALVDLVGEAQLATQSKVLATENLTAIVTAAAEWYGISLATALKPPYLTQSVSHVHSACTLGGIIGGAKTPADVFTPAFLAAATKGFVGDDPWSCVLRHNSLVHDNVTSPTPPPMLVALAEQDELLSGPIQQAAYDTLCAAGLPVRYLECAGLGHTAGALASLPEQLAFLHARRAGEPLTGTCQRGPAVTCTGVVKLP